MVGRSTLDIMYAIAYDMRMHTIDDLRPFHRTAVESSIEVVAAVATDDLRRPTPCAGWNLADLLAHMTAQHRGFAAAARGNGADLAVWDPATVTDRVAADPAGTYAAAAADVLDAFAADDALETAFALPEFGPGASFPGALAIGFHFVDYVVHGWDVARSIGAHFELPASVVTAVLPVVFAVPDGEFRAGDGAPFGPAIVADDGLSDFDRVLLYLGRSPAWAPR
jgi:uncharacterized protein (TIGR03086 family)